MPALPRRLSVKVLVLDTRGWLLLLRRSAESKNHAGKWEFPGGKIDGGESFDEGLLREVHEETGLVIELGDVLGASESVMPGLRVVYLFLEGQAHTDQIQLSDEHDGFVWVPPAESPAYDMCPQFQAIAASYALSFERAK